MYDDETTHGETGGLPAREPPQGVSPSPKGGRVGGSLERSAARCVQRAESLIASGTHEAQAWSWAIRSVLLESLED